MVRVISIRRTTPADFKLTKLFGIDNFSVAKEFGKVFIIIIYYNNYNLSARLLWQLLLSLTTELTNFLPRYFLFLFICLFLHKSGGGGG